MNSSHCVIVGGGQAAAQLAASLRQNKWGGDITIIGGEPIYPYHRPPLSKSYLCGEKTASEILIRSQHFYEKNDIQTVLGERATFVDRSKKVVVLANGAEIAYTKLALTTGSRVRKIATPGTLLSGVFYLRDLGSADNIRQYVSNGGKAVIVGGGYIGLETASALRKCGMDVTVLEALPRILQRVTAPEVSAFYSRIHSEEGVRIITNTTLESLQGDGRVQSVTHGGGSTLEADMVIIGVGIIPETELAKEAGLEVENGIVVDAYARSSDHDIVAAGDCTFHYNPIYQRCLRLESVQNAVDQAKVAAATVCGKFEAYSALPWFWSDQYDLKLQIAGLSQGFDQVVIRGDIDRQRDFAAFYLREGQLIAVDAVNRPREFMAAKKALLLSRNPDPAKLADECFDIQATLAQ